MAKLTIVHTHNGTQEEIELETDELAGVVVEAVKALVQRKIQEQQAKSKAKEVPE